jgi:hypothetical protein
MWQTGNLSDRENKQLSTTTTTKENAERIPYDYKVGQKVLLKRGNENKYEAQYKGPYPILKLHNNGKVHLKVGAVTDTYNVRRLTPYTEPKPFNHGGKCNMRTSEPASEPPLE